MKGRGKRYERRRKEVCKEEERDKKARGKRYERRRKEIRK
jgi:hypothetical protein